MWALRILAMSVSLFLLAQSAVGDSGSKVQKILEEWRAIDSSLEVQSLTPILLKHSLHTSDSNELIGALRRLWPVDRFEDRMLALVHTLAQQGFEKLETPRGGRLFFRESSKSLARALKIFWRKNYDRDSEGVFLALVHFSKTDFKDLEELSDFYFKESLFFFPPDLKEGKEDLIHLMLFHFDDQMQRLRRWLERSQPMTIEKWSQLIMILELPRLLLRSFQGPEIPREDFPWPVGSYEFFKKRWFDNYEAALRKIFQESQDLQQLVLAAKIQVPESAEWQMIYQKIIVEYSARLVEFGAKFRDFGAFVENLLPQDRALREKLQEIAKKIMRQDLRLVDALEVFSKETAKLSLAEMAQLEALRRVIRQVLNADNCQKILAQWGSFGP
jgi:hypothetical protein